MKIGILGGSFNPVHYGHIAVARHVVGTGLVDKVWFSLSPQNPLKDKSILMPVEERIKLLERALENEEDIGLTTVELELPKPSYTIDALRRLQKDNPGVEFTLIGGADILENFPKWKSWDEIIRDFGLIIYPRGKERTQLPKSLECFSDRIKLIENAPLMNISSTAIRNGG